MRGFLGLRDPTRRPGARAIGQIPISWDPDADAEAKERAHEQFRWFAGGWAVNADLPTPAGFAGGLAAHHPRPGGRAASPADPTSTRSSRRSRPTGRPGSPTSRVVQVGDEGQQRFLDEAAGPLLEKLRAAAP